MILLSITSNTPQNHGGTRMSLREQSLQEKRYLKEKEVKELYGLGYTAIRTLVKNRQLRRRMVGRAWRYPVDDLEAIFSADTRVSHRYRKRRKDYL